MNHKRLKELRLAGEERCEPEFDPKNTQVPDGDIINFVTTKEEVMEYEKRDILHKNSGRRLTVQLFLLDGLFTRG